MAKRELWELKNMQSAPLPVKVLLTKARVREWINEFGENGVYVSFSGGKDSTVLLDIVRQDYPNVPAVFCDTGLEYPEIRQFVKTVDNVEWIRPEMTFKQVIETCGYPFITKEVSECVFGARRYLDSINDKDNPKSYRELVGLADKVCTMRGGYHELKEFPQRWRQLRGIAEYAMKTKTKSRGSVGQLQGAKATWDSPEKDGESNDGEYP